MRSLFGRVHAYGILRDARGTAWLISPFKPKIHLNTSIAYLFLYQPKTLLQLNSAVAKERRSVNLNFRKKIQHVNKFSAIYFARSVYAVDAYKSFYSFFFGGGRASFEVHILNFARFLHV